MILASHLPRSFFLLLASALLAFLEPGCKRAAEETPQTPPAPVKVDNASKQFLGGWTDLYGTTQPVPGRLARISTPVDGRVLSVLRDAGGKPLAEGQAVKAGDVIVTLDSRLVQEQLRQAGNAVAQAEIEVKRLQELRAGNSATGAGLVSQIMLEKAVIDRDDAYSKQKALEHQLTFYTLTAPISGRIGLIQVVPGQTVAAGTVVTDVIDLDEIEVLCFVPPHIVNKLAVGQPAGFDNARGEPQQTGKVVFCAVQAQPDTGNFAVKVRLDNKDHKLRANTVVNLRVMTEPEKERWVIPEDAVMEDQEPPLVVVVQDVKTTNDKGEVVKEEKKARRCKVTLGVRAPWWKQVEVLAIEPLPIEKVDEGAAKKGLKEETGPITLESPVVIEGGHGLQDGDVVKVEEGEGGGGGDEK